MFRLPAWHVHLGHGLFDAAAFKTQPNLFVPVSEVSSPFRKALPRVLGMLHPF